MTAELSTSHPSSTDSRTLALALARGCLDKKAENIQVLDVSNLIGHLTHYFVIVSGRNRRQVQAIADEVRQCGRLAGVAIAGMAGYREGSWVLLDFQDVIVHVFLAETREHYDLELHWGDAPRLALESIAPVTREQAQPENPDSTFQPPPAP
jgi:ribosome-associated protein